MLRSTCVETKLELVSLETALREIVREEVQRVSDAQPGSEWLGVDAAASYIDSTADAVRALVKRRAIPHYKAGGRLRFNRREIDAWIRSEAIANEPQP